MSDNPIFVYMPMTIMSNIFFGLISIVVIGGLALAIYLVVKMVYSDIRYRSLKLPISEEFIIGDKGKAKKFINPVKESKFNLSQETGDKFIDDARKTADEMHRQKQEKEELKAKLEAKKLKKELAKKAQEK